MERNIQEITKNIKMTKIKRFFVFSIGMSLFMVLSGCSHDPISQLKSDLLNNQFNEAFWIPHYQQKTQLWHEAAQYCLSHSDKPNCKPVLTLAWVGDGHKKAPKIGESGESIHLMNP